MKIIGNIQLEFDENDVPTNIDYKDGVIAQLTAKELTTLIHLQAVINEKCWNTSELFRSSIMDKEKIQNVDFSEAFAVIMNYVSQKFYVIQLKNYVDEMEQMLYDLENKEEGFS